MYMRVTRTRIDPAKLDEARKVDVAAVVRRMPGCRSYMLGVDRASGRALSVSTWDTEDHARWSADADAVSDVRARLEALGLQVDAIDIFELISS